MTQHDDIDIGSRRELFVDDYLIAEQHNVRLELQRPERRDVAFLADAPWEDDIAGFYSVVQEPDGTARLYYRASIPDRANEDNVLYALAESHDGGMSFTRPGLGLIEFKGSKNNNLLFIGEPPFVPPPAFIDTNPACRPEERYKGLSARWEAVFAMASPDGVHWQPMSEQPLQMDGTFDTVNTAFWDAEAGCYRSFTRYFENLKDGMTEADVLGPRPRVVRAIQSSTSEDFLHWTPVVHHTYDDDYTNMQLYTNATIPCPGAEHIYLAFPNRYVQERQPNPAHEHPGINDALFMTSRDACHWKRRPEAWVRPGPDPLNWTERNNYPTWGIVTTSPTEWSMFISEHYRHPGTPCQLRRLSIRPHGFVAVHADFTGGELVTKPFRFTGTTLFLNYASSAAGSVQVEVQNPDGTAVDGYAMADIDPMFGDSLDAQVRWRNRPDLQGLAGQSIRLRFVLRDADLFAFRLAAVGFSGAQSAALSPTAASRLLIVPLV